jgi:hypothetical protein
MSDEARRLKANRKLEGKPCGWCQRSFILGDDAVVCADDQAEHHAKCWDDKGGCSTKDCVNAPLKRLDVAPPGFPPIPPQPGFGFAPPPFGHPYMPYPPQPMGYGPPPHGPNPYAAPPLPGAQPQAAPVAQPPPNRPPPAPGPQAFASPTSAAFEHARPLDQPAPPPRAALRPGFKFCVGCGNQVLIETQICDFCNAILTPDGVYRGPTYNAPGSVASLVYGIIGLFPCTAVVFGVLALVKSREAKSAILFNPRYDGNGMATAGMVLGIIDLIVGGIFWIARLFG